MANKDFNYKFQGTGLSNKEMKWAKKRFKEYQEQYHVETLSDLQLLEELTYREAQQERYKKKIEELDKANKKAERDLVPSNILKELDTNLTSILSLKEKLGFFENKEQTDAFKYITTLLKKFAIWKKEHIEERKVSCPFCSEIFFLNIRTTDYTPSKLKLYKDKVLCNEHLWYLFKEGKISKEDVSKILNTSPDYVDWLAKHIYKD